MPTFHANPQQFARIGTVSSGQTAGVRLGEKLGETRAALVQFMREDPRVTAIALGKRLYISTTAVEKKIRILKAQEYVTRVGPAKGAVGTL